MGDISLVGPRIVEVVGLGVARGGGDGFVGGCVGDRAAEVLGNDRENGGAESDAEDDDDGD